MKVEETLLYWSTKNRTRRNIFYADPQSMKVEETLLYGPTKKETRINPFYEQQKIAESILYGPIKNEVEEPIYKGPQQK